MNKEIREEKDDKRCIAENKTVGYGEGWNSLIFDNRIEREWLSTKDAAHYLRLSENALRIMVHRGQVRFHKFGRRLRFRLSDCQALFQKEGA